MTTVAVVEVINRDVLFPLFKEHKYDTVVMNSVLEGHSGVAYADSKDYPSVARLDVGPFTVLGGSSSTPHIADILHYRKISYVTPENTEWRRLLRDEFSCSEAVSFTEFLTHSLDGNKLIQLVRGIPPGFRLVRIDDKLVDRLISDLGTTYFFDGFQSRDDYLRRGIGYCVLCNDRVVSAAASMAACNGAIDVEINTAPGFQRRGLGTSVGARLVLYCLRNGIEPKWLAATSESAKLARRLGYEKGESYETLAIGSGT